MVGGGYSMGGMFLLFSMVKDTSDMPAGFWSILPLKITWSIRSPRKTVGLCSPNTQRIASTRLVLPQPVGPTMAETPALKTSLGFLGKDLKPMISSSDRYNFPLLVC